MSSPFHVGEHWAQIRAGVREKAEQIGSRMIRSFMPELHREFVLIPGRCTLDAAVLASSAGVRRTPSSRLYFPGQLREPCAA